MLDSKQVTLEKAPSLLVCNKCSSQQINTFLLVVLTAHLGTYFIWNFRNATGFISKPSYKNCFVCFLSWQFFIIISHRQYRCLNYEWSFIILIFMLSPVRTCPQFNGVVILQQLQYYANTTHRPVFDWASPFSGALSHLFLELLARLMVGY